MPLDHYALCGFEDADTTGRQRQRLLGTVRRREETVHVVFRGMKADMIPAITGRDFVPIRNEEQVWLCREVVVARMQEDGKAARPSTDVLSGNGLAITKKTLSFAARRRIGPAALRFMGLGSNDSADGDHPKCDQAYC